MKIEKNKTKFYLALVPHKETREILRKYRDKLIKNGLTGVYPFPFIAPLAESEKPLPPEELKKYARGLRNEIGNDKFTAKEAGTSSLIIDNNEIMLYGFLLKRDKGLLFENISLFKQDKITNNEPVPCPMSPVPIIGLFLANKDKQYKLPSLPQITFRASAVANFYIKPIEDGFKWKIGALYWLPKK